MKHDGRTWWFVFAGCVVLVLGAMVGVTILVVHLEHDHRDARAVSDHQDTLHLALWRMDSWLAPRLARETARPYFEYYAWYAPEMVYTRLLNQIRAGDVLSPSPLLTFDSEFIPIHFQIEPDGLITSPQVPTGNQLDLAEASLLPPGRVAQKSTLLDDVRVLFGDRDVSMLCSTGEAQVAERLNDNWVADVAGQSGAPGQRSDTDRNRAELQKRAANTYQTQQVLEQQVWNNALVPTVAGVVDVGPLVPIWIECSTAFSPKSPMAGLADGHLLVFLRRVTAADQQFYQGFVADWPAIRAALSDQAADLLPHVAITPTPKPRTVDDETAWLLTTIPATIRAAAPPAAAAEWPSVARITLFLMWLGVLIAIVAAGLTLRSTIDFANRRSRFASAVTHELRTPLTTFQMYSELLADGVIDDDARQRIYHETLRDESTRLNALVENVLAYSRIEDGRAEPRFESMTLNDLIEFIRPQIERRAEKAAATVTIDADDLPDTAFLVDRETLSRIVFNLIDNACKYGSNGEPPDIQLRATAQGSTLTFTVRDHGPGVSERHSRRIFEPFDRGGVEPGSETPGVGLGLSLSRELAATLGGSLRLTPVTDGDGASFTLEVPLQPASSE